MRVLTITGPTVAHEREYTTGELLGKLLPSFDDKLNAALAELDAQNASYTITFQSPSHGWHVAYIEIDTAAAPAHMSMQAFADQLGVSYCTVSTKVRQGEIEAISVGRRKLIPVSEYRRLSSPTA